MIELLRKSKSELIKTLHGNPELATWILENPSIQKVAEVSDIFLQFICEETVVVAERVKLSDLGWLKKKELREKLQEMQSNLPDDVMLNIEKDETHITICISKKGYIQWLEQE